MLDKNSLLYWFPKIMDLDIPYPKTEILPVPWENNYWQYITNPLPKRLIKQIKKTAKKVGYPLFMRTDQLSGKHCIHKWIPYVESEEDLLTSIPLLLEESAMASILGLPIKALVFREFIKLEAKFKCFAGMPVARERRYFVNNGVVLCHHPYWIEDAIRFWMKDYKPPKNWKSLLKKINTETKDEIEILTKYASHVAQQFEGYWSIDFAKTKYNGWILIDMALGKDSWHPDCKHKYQQT